MLSFIKVLKIYDFIKKSKALRSSGELEENENFIDIELIINTA